MIFDFFLKAFQGDIPSKLLLDCYEKAILRFPELNTEGALNFVNRVFSPNGLYKEWGTSLAAVALIYKDFEEMFRFILHDIRDKSRPSV